MTPVPQPIVPPPALVAHADWGTAPGKRWMTRAVWDGGRYRAWAPEPVGDAWRLLSRLRGDANGAVLIGFDFPIGLPASYADQAGVTDFLGLLPRLGEPGGDWADFFDVADRPDAIGLHRPFYPRRPGGTSQRQLLDALGLARIDQLRRRCELAHPERRAASPLFWTLGAQQVGKAAIGGWRDVLAPGRRDPAQNLLIWPFSGPLPSLLRPGSVVATETYPGEVYHHLGLTWRAGAPGQASGKRSQGGRRAHAPALLRWVEAAGVALEPTLEETIVDGFGASPDGEDPFDAAVGLFGMLNVVLGRRATGEPGDPRVRRIEGWIFGQEAR